MCIVCLLCVYIYSCGWISLCRRTLLCAHACRGRRSAPTNLLYHAPPCFLRRGLSLNLELPHSARLPDQWSSCLFSLALGLQAQFATQAHVATLGCLHACRQPKRRFFYLLGEHFTNWAIWAPLSPLLNDWEESKGTCLHLASFALAKSHDQTCQVTVCHGRNRTDCGGRCSLACSSCFFIQPRTTCTDRGGPAHRKLGPSAEVTNQEKCARKPVWWKQFLLWGSLLPDDPNLCQSEKQLCGTASLVRQLTRKLAGISIFLSFLIAFRETCLQLSTVWGNWWIRDCENS